MTNERVWMVEDRSSVIETVGPLVRRLQVGFSACSHGAAIRSAEDWGGDDVVLLDAYDRAAQQDDRSVSAFAALDILERIDARDPRDRPRVVVYSTAMRTPHVHLAVRSYGVVAACYEAEDLIDHLDEVRRGEYDHAIAPPVPSDWAEIHPRLPPAADLAAAHQLMRSRADAWRLVWDPQASFRKATQVWINRTVLPVLKLDADRDAGIGYRLAVQVVRQMAGLPVRG